MKFYVGDKSYGSQPEYISGSKNTQPQEGPCIVEIDGEKFYIITADGFEIGMTVEINYLPRSHMVLDCIQIE